LLGKDTPEMEEQRTLYSECKIRMYEYAKPGSGYSWNRKHDELITKYYHILYPWLDKEVEDRVAVFENDMKKAGKIYAELSRLLDDENITER
jgi:hypothetical protein